MSRERLLNKIANAAVDVDELAEQRAVQYRQRFKAILLDPKLRDKELWSQLLENAKLDPVKWAALTPQELNKVKRSQRGELWSRAMKVLFAASAQQAEMETIILPLSDLSAKVGKTVGTLSQKMGKSDIQQAALDGFKQLAAAERERRRETNKTTGT